MIWGYHGSRWPTIATTSQKSWAISPFRGFNSPAFHSPGIVSRYKAAAAVRLCQSLPEMPFYPPVNKHSNGKSPSWIGNTSSNAGFSIAMLDYRSVGHKSWIGRGSTSHGTQDLKVCKFGLEDFSFERLDFWIPWLFLESYSTTFGG